MEICLWPRVVHVLFLTRTPDEDLLPLQLLPPPPPLSPSLACNSTARLRLCNKIRRDLLWIISTLPDHTRERELDFSKRFLYYRVYSLEEEEKRKKERERKRGFTMRFLPSSCISCRVICKKKISSLRWIEGGGGEGGGGPGNGLGNILPI